MMSDTPRPSRRLGVAAGALPLPRLPLLAEGLQLARLSQRAGVCHFQPPNVCRQRAVLFVGGLWPGNVILAGACCTTHLEGLYVHSPNYLGVHPRTYNWLITMGHDE